MNDKQLRQARLHNQLRLLIKEYGWFELLVELEREVGHAQSPHKGVQGIFDGIRVDMDILNQNLREAVEELDTVVEV